MSEVLLNVENLKTWLGDGDDPVRAVDGVDLTIHRGETYALLGESGCGKSMTALSIMRLLPPVGQIVDGRVLLEGSNLLDLPEQEMRSERGGRMAMIFQEPMTSLNPVLTVGAQIEEALKAHADTAHQTGEERVIELLGAVGIPDPERRVRSYPHQLSGGMKQRVMIAMALAGRPQLLIADEPTTALDVTIQAQVLTLIKDLQKQTGMAILLITHDLGVVSEVADRVGVMYAGQLVEEASRDQFFTNPKHPYSQKLFSSLPGQEKRQQKLTVIKGSVPSLRQEFIGCRFIDRCDYATEFCAEHSPQWQEMEGETGLRCHFPQPMQQGAELAESSAAQSGDESVQVAEKTLLLDVKDLAVHFPIHKGVFKRVVGHVKAVDGLSLSIERGKTLALVGESGCGKTTVGKGILQLVHPTAGSVQFDDEQLIGLKGERMRKRRSDLQIIFQDPMASMNPRMLIGDIIEEGMRAQRIGGNSEARGERVAGLLRHVGLSDEVVSRYPHEFSGGQRQRVCIARALAVEPRLVICDEPTSALDVSVQAQILNLLKSLQEEHQLSYLFITHNISVVAYLAHEVAVMYLGRIVERGAVEEILASPRHPYTQALLSAVPVIDSASRREVIRLEGDMPSPANPPEGCHFHPRCPKASTECQAAYPSEVVISESHRAHCLKIEL